MIETHVSPEELFAEGRRLIHRGIAIAAGSVVVSLCFGLLTAADVNPLWFGHFACPMVAGAFLARGLRALFAVNDVVRLRKKLKKVLELTA